LLIQPAATIPVGSDPTRLILSPDGKWLYFLSQPEWKAGQIDAPALRLKQELRLADGTVALCLAPNAEALYAVAASGRRQGVIQVINPSRMEVRRSFPIAVDPYDVVARDDGLLFISGRSGDWTDIAVVDVRREAAVARWGGVWNRSLLKLSPDQSRLYLASQGVSPGFIESFVVPRNLDERPAPLRASTRQDQPLGGEFLLTPDGKHLLCKTGTILRIGPTRESDLQFAASVEPFLAAAVDPARGAALFLTTEGSLRLHSYPDFKLQTVSRLGVVADCFAFDAKHGRLYAAVNGNNADNGSVRDGKGGQIHVYDLKEVLQRTAGYAPRSGND
jgi:hypothetical protein